jgi:hypothetical protein
MTLPSSDSYITYGGEIINYSEVEDPNTDLDQEQSNSMRASAAALSDTCFRAILVFYIDVGNIPVIVNYNAVWDVQNTSPLPIISYDGVGVYTVKFPTSVIDLRGNPQNINLLGGIANPDCNNFNGYFCTVQKIDLVTFTIFNWSAVDRLLQDTGFGPDSKFVLCVR